MKKKLNAKFYRVLDIIFNLNFFSNDIRRDITESDEDRYKGFFKKNKNK